MNKSKILLGLLLTLAFGIPSGWADDNDCLQSLKGPYAVKYKGVADPVFSVADPNGAWQFRRPEGLLADKEKHFRYSFDRSDTLTARVIPQEHLEDFGRAALSRYMEKPGDFAGVVVGCGLATEDFYLVRLDLSAAKPALLAQVVQQQKWSEGLKGARAKATEKEISDLRRKRYFSGHPFHLEGVTQGVLGLLLEK